MCLDCRNLKSASVVGLDPRYTPSSICAKRSTEVPGAGCCGLAWGLLKGRPHLVARLEHEVRNARRHIDSEIGVAVEAPGDVIDVGLHATEVCTHYAQLGILAHQVIARRKYGPLRGPLGMRARRIP